MAEVAHHFDDAGQQHEASLLGMWVFLATEIMFFGGLILAYVVYRTGQPAAFELGSRQLAIPLGALNTGLLLTSSLTMALAVHAARAGRRRLTVAHLGATALLGLAFLAVKGFEYHEKIVSHLVPGADFALPRETEMFFYLYFTLTGLHAVHMLAGVGVIAVMMVLAHRGRFTPTYVNPLEATGLYWHFVDIVWIYLFPLLYLIGHRP